MKDEEKMEKLRAKIWGPIVVLSESETAAGLANIFCFVAGNADVCRRISFVFAGYNSQESADQLPIAPKDF